jgi:hypothetical protein
MRVSRFFRKYSRILLLVFMSLLLVVFLIGDVIGRGMGRREVGDIQLGQAFGQPVYRSETLAAEADFDLARRLGAAAPWIETPDLQKRSIAMYVLLEEARRAGIQVGREPIIESFRKVSGAAEVLSAIRNQSRRSLNSIYDALARVNATMILARYQLAAASATSTPDLERAYRDHQQKARVLISALDANAFLSGIPTPTEEELQAHFEEARDRDPAHTDEALAYGYRIPDRVQVEYLTVDPEEIKESVGVSDKKARRYYEDNKQQYMKTVESDSQFVLEQEQPQQVQMTYEEAEKQVREDYRAAKAVLEAQSLVNRIHQEARRPWATAPLGEDNVRLPAADDEIMPFTGLQQKFSTEYRVEYKKTDLVTERELAVEPGFGRASAVVSRESVRAPALAFWVEGLATAGPDDPVPVLRIDEPGPVVLESRGGQDADPVPYQAYVFRVIRVEPSGPPASLDEVREEATANLRRIKALELVGEHARALAAQARQVGLTQAVEQAEELKALLADTEGAAPLDPVTSRPADSRYLRMLEPYEPRQFTRQPRPYRNVGLAPGLPEQVFALADDSLDAADPHRVVVIPLAKSLRWGIVELLEVEPIYRGEFEMERSELERQASWSRSQQFFAAWFDPDNILSRAGWVPTAEVEP